MLSRTKKFSAWSALALSLSAAAMGCSSAPTDENTSDGFISDSPFNGGGKGNDTADGSSSGTGGGEASPGAPNAGGDGGGAQKAIQEADIIQVDGNKLFALSQYGGLSVIDMTNPSNLSIVGHYPIQGVPFEMYLQNGIVYAMFSSYGQWECNADYTDCSYIQSSHIEALNVQNPANITQIGTFDVPGEISDSRIVGDVLYAVSYENGYCWNCADAPTTTVTSITLNNPADIHVVDSVGFDSSDPNGYGWGKRSVSVTQDRMYIAGIEWDGNSSGHSTIQIVDISDPNGLLHVGASVEASGMIESRWQMDEHQGVLRVVSQPGIWENGVPYVQTFQVNSSDSITPLGFLTMTLPKPERLRSARFDGTRLYAITAEQTDPLFTIDVSNPAQPAQIGELELPGWIYHLEPRGNRLFALGYDNANPEGSMNVSLFDVSNMANPTLINRVAFGGDWSWAPEDQDRIHKAFKIDSTLGAIFVPYGAYSYDETNGYYGCSHVESGIQIVDFTLNSLTKRGMAPLDGFARRALIHQGRLFSVSDSEVSAYDLTNRDNPARLDRLGLSAWVNQSAKVGSNIVRVSADWWTSAATLDVVPASDPSRVEPLGRLDLKDVVGNEDSNDCYGWGYFYGAQMFTLDASRVAITWSTYPYYWDGPSGGGNNTAKTHVVVVNIADPASPIVEGRISMPFSTETWSQWGSLDGGQAIVHVGDNLVFRHVQRSADGSKEYAWLETVDLSNPATPEKLPSRMLPDGSGHSLLLQNGSQVLTSHWEPVPGQPNKVKFFLDRVSYANGQPGQVNSRNVPGALLAYDAATTHALTVDYKRISVDVMDPDTCWQTYGWNTWAEQIGATWQCSYMTQTMKLIDVNQNNVTVLDTEEIDSNVSFYGTRVTDSRIFSQGYRYSNNNNSATYSIFVIGDISGNSIQSAYHDLDSQDYLWSVAASGDRLVLASGSKPGIHVLDATDLSNMTLAKKGDVSNYVQSVTLDGTDALCAMGPYGLEIVDVQ